MAKPKKRRRRHFNRKKKNADLLYSKLSQFFVISNLNFWKLLISILIFFHEFVPPLFVGVLANSLNSNFSTDLFSLSSHKLSLTNQTSNWSWSKNVTLEKLQSRRTLESLHGTDFDDEPLDPPEWSQLSKQERRILRKQMRKQKNKTGLGSLPGGRQALAIATKDAIKPGHCRIMQMKQRVRMEGCTPKIIVNNFCYGQCNSFFIPKISRKRVRTAFESCSVCQPTAFTPIQVTLSCPDRNPPYVEQEVMTIKECSCKSVCSITNDVL